MSQFQELIQAVRSARKVGDGSREKQYREQLLFLVGQGVFSRATVELNLERVRRDG